MYVSAEQQQRGRRSQPRRQKKASSNWRETPNTIALARS
jgi:hypothetical protein